MRVKVFYTLSILGEGIFMKLRLRFILFTCFLFGVGGVMGLEDKELEVQRLGVIAVPCVDLVATQVKFTLEEEPVVQLAATCIPELFGEQQAYRRTQLLFNEPVIILEEKNGWYRVRAIEQSVIDDQGLRGCHGWIKSKNVRIINKPIVDLNLVVVSKQANVYEKPLTDSGGDVLPACMSFSCGTKLRGVVHNLAWCKVQFPDDNHGFVAARDLVSQDELKLISIDGLREMIVGQALQFAHIPYVWGGRSGEGIDCSALIQLAYVSCGITTPRYAHGQWKACKPRELAQLKQGDLIFLGTLRDDQLVMIHVMLYIGNGMLIEAHGFLGKVRMVSVHERLGKSLHELKNGDAVLLRRFVYGGSFIE